MRDQAPHAVQDAEMLLHLKRCLGGIRAGRLFPSDFGKLYVTRDGGQHWQLVTP